MSTKAQIATEIDTLLASGTTITSVEHREVLKDGLHNILDNIYSDEINETETTTNVFTKNGLTTDTYDLIIKKQGSTVTINGTIIGNGSVQNVVASITNSEFRPTNLFTSYGLLYTTVYNLLTGNSCEVKIAPPISSDNGTLIIGNLQNGETLRFQITYNTLN